MLSLLRSEGKNKQKALSVELNLYQHSFNGTTDPTSSGGLDKPGPGEIGKFDGRITALLLP